MNTRIAIIGIIVLVIGIVLGVIVPLVGVAHDLPSLHPFVVGVVCIVAGAVITVIGVSMKKKNVLQEEKKNQANLDEHDHTMR
jgi:putative Mn2+ efflux pump MntP